MGYISVPLGLESPSSSLATRSFVLGTGSRFLATARNIARRSIPTRKASSRFAPGKIDVFHFEFLVRRLGQCWNLFDTHISFLASLAVITLNNRLFQPHEQTQWLLFCY